MSTFSKDKIFPFTRCFYINISASSKERGRGRGWGRDGNGGEIGGKIVGEWEKMGVIVKKTMGFLVAGAEERTSGERILRKDRRGWIEEREDS